MDKQPSKKLQFGYFLGGLKSKSRYFLGFSKNITIPTSILITSTLRVPPSGGGGGGKTLGRKVPFSTALEQTSQKFSNFLCLFVSSFSKTFQNNLNYAS